ncbi:hypothetical protein AcW1_007358 [Taiwanofungus camphoratus]|nr:hypothetical protein AcW2_007574 [Antrodia cinnamomea]KAI0953034.1 hypothetical protein AcW1_007358 [Antrodia cinnamomea]
MTILTLSLSSPLLTENEKSTDGSACIAHNVNPVVDGALYGLQKTDLVTISERGVEATAKYIHSRLQAESYTPRTWRTHPLHLLSPDPYLPADPATKACLDWLFLISSLNFSFWSEREGHQDRYGVEWWAGWGSEEKVVHTGYWSLVAAVNRALEEGIPFTDPAFYSSEQECPDSLFEHIFRPAPHCSETIPLLNERIRVLREVGRILCSDFGGSFQGFHKEFLHRHRGRGNALQLVQMVADTFPSFRDETNYQGRRIYIWKRAQILVAESWAAFYPASPSLPHPLFPNGAEIHQLTMFADYRVPQILHHLRILVYPVMLIKLLKRHRMLMPGCREELSIRAASIIAVEKLKVEISRLSRSAAAKAGYSEDRISSVLIDFFLWDLAKRIEEGKESIREIEISEMLPAHRTRSIWY